MSETKPPTCEDVERALAEMAQRLARAQTDLPPDAAKILNENLWDLYE